MSGISFEEFAGEGTGSPPVGSTSSSDQGQRATPSPAALSFEDFAALGGATQPTVLEGTLRRLKNVGGEAAALADLVLGMPNFMVKTGAQLGGATLAVASGEENPFAAGRRTGERYQQALSKIPVLRTADSPLRHLLESLESRDVYQQALTTQGMEKFSSAIEKAGEWAEQVTGGRVGRDAVPMLVETLMAASPGLAGRGKKGIDPEVLKRTTQAAQDTRRRMLEKQEIEAKAEAPLTPEEFMARTPVQDQINSVLGIRTPAEQARVTRQRRADLQAAFGRGQARERALTPEEQGQLDVAQARQSRIYETPEQSIFTAEERLAREKSYAESLKEEGGEAAGTAYEIGSQPLRKKIDQAEVLRILRKPGFERTAEDLVVLRAARQEGKATPEVAAILSAAGIGAAVGGLLDENKLRGAAIGGLTAAAPFGMLAGLRGGNVASRFKQAGAVKGPGGMWHPEAVERLSEPLKSSLARDVAMDGIPLREHTAEAVGADGLRYIQSIDQWSSRAIRNYLNRYAGTERDPLKDVEIPSGEGTRRWGELWDRAINKDQKGLDFTDGAGKYEPGFEKVKPDETIFNFGRNRGLDAEDISSYLSHVGDYLRQNVALAPEEWYARQSAAERAKLQDRAEEAGGHSSQKNFLQWIREQPEFKRDTDLSRYDLVRAVRETAEHDKKMAKQMEKAAASSMKDMPVYKEYPDGFKWVELKLPEKLTEEQAKGVRKATDAEMKSLGSEVDGDLGYVAIGADGKPIKNTYTGEIAAAGTPEEAWLAGRLAEEGNVMGHCVGGYCPAVASGESRIFSLRDPKGKSHVTVEVEPRRGFSGEDLQRLGRDDLWQEYKANKNAYFNSLVDFLAEKHPEFFKRMKEQQDIVQIKGKQNRAPNAEYLPYVQDFVKEGKWGEVGDLGNTGLLKHEGKYLTREEALAQGWSPDGNDPRFGGNQRGFIDQSTVVGLTALGLGGLVGSTLGDDPIKGAVLGMLAGAAVGFTAAGRARAKDAIDKIDYAGGRISTRLGNYGPELKFALRQLDEHTVYRAGELLNRSLPLMKELQKLPASTREAFENAAWNGDSKAIAEIAKGNPQLVAGIRETRNILDELGAEAQSLKRFKTMLPNFFPRRVKDLPGLKEYIAKTFGTQESTRLEAKIKAAEDLVIKQRGSGLTGEELSSLVNRELRGMLHARPNPQPGYAKPRTIRELTPELRKFYHDLPTSIVDYVTDTVKDLEAAKFFGRDLVQSKTASGREVTQIDMSIGNRVGRLIAEGKLPKEAQLDVENILASRFKGGERAPNWWTSQIRGLGHLTLLGDPASAAVQLGDPLMSLYAHGPVATISAVARSLSGNKKVSVQDFHLTDHISQEFMNAGKLINASKTAQGAMIGGGAVVGALLADNELAGALAGASVGLVAAVGTANAVRAAFKASGFSMIDNFGKNVHLNAAFQKYQSWSRTPKGRERIAEKYQRAYGEDFPQLIHDLQMGRLTENTRSLLWNELADMQPISKAEMSQMWLDSPNAGRLALTLKTFMQTQIDIARRDAYNKIKEGKRAEGIKNLTALALTLGFAGASGDAVKSFLLGHDVKFDLTENILKTVGFGEYVRDKAKKEPLKAVGGAFVPPVQVMDAIITQDPKAVKYIPVVGELYYNWELGGREEAEVREAKKARKEGRDYKLSDRAREHLREKRRKAKEKREANR